MLDNDVVIAIRLELLNQLALCEKYDMTGVSVNASFEGTQQATGDTRALFMHKITNPQVGTGFINNGNTRTQQHLKRATYQFSALNDKNDDDVNKMSASDVANIAADLLQSHDAIMNLRAKGVKIERITDVRQGFFINDSDMNENSPSFDLTVSYQNDYERTVSEISGLNINKHGV